MLKQGWLGGDDSTQGPEGSRPKIERYLSGGEAHAPLSRKIQARKPLKRKRQSAGNGTLHKENGPLTAANLVHLAKRTERPKSDARKKKAKRWVPEHTTNIPPEDGIEKSCVRAGSPPGQFLRGPKQPGRTTLYPHRNTEKLEFLRTWK